MPFGLLISLSCHVALLAWAFVSMRAVQELPTPDTPAISADIITPSEFLRLKQGSEDAKNLETKANDKPTPDDSKNETKKPDNAPPPPPAEAPPPPEPPKVEPPKPPEPDPIAKQIEQPPPPPEPAPGPTPEEQKLLEQKIEEQRLADEAKKKAEEDAKKKAEDEARKKKLADELKKKKADEAKKKFDPSKIASLLEKAPNDAAPKALIDKDPTKKGQQAAGTSQTATATGKEAGTATGTDSVLSAREQDLLKGMIKGQLAQCWRLPGGGGGTETPVVTLRWRLRPDGELDGEPAVKSAPSDPLGQAAADAAMRAVRGCQPFRLPAESYEGWKDIEWVFDPRQML